MNPKKSSLHFKAKSQRLYLEMLVFTVAIVLSGFMFLRESMLPFSPVPILAVAAWIIVPRLGSRSDQIIFLAFFILCFFIDDTAFGPWNKLGSFTADLGVILFQSFGLTGFEVFTLVFACMCWVIHRREERQLWFQLGLLPLVVIGSLMFTSALVAVLLGTLSGGVMETALIQIRFLYLLPIWCFIGFVVMRDEAFFRRIFFWLTILMIFKSLQTIFIWFTNRAALAEAEYIYEHYFSAYLVVSMLHLIYWAYQKPQTVVRAACIAGLGITFIAYALNDRRTSYVGIPFAILMMMCFLPRSFMRRYGRILVASSVIGGSLTVLSWNLPGPLGFVGSLYRSFGQEAGTDGPSYRDLENANLLREVSRAPLMGLGFGKEFDEFYPMPSVASVYPRYKMIPHNNLLYAWCYGGPLTIAGLSLLFLFMFAVAGRLIYDEDMKGLRYIGIFCLFYFAQFFSYVFGDLGLQVSRNQLLAGILLGGSYRLYRQRKKELGKC